jgi:hypothetical protein
VISVEWISSLLRILAQPIYRDALLFGKFLAGVATFSIGHEGPWTKGARLVQYLLALLGRIAEALGCARAPAPSRRRIGTPLKERNVILDRHDGRDHGTSL